MNNWENTKVTILEAPLPVYDGDSYSVIPHSMFLEEVSKKIKEKGYSIADERYLTANNCKIITGVYRISNNEDEDMTPAITFTNSYNKTRKAEIRACAMVLVCKNGMMGTINNSHYARKHTGNALEEFREHIDTVVNGLEDEFRRLLQNKKEMKAINLSKTVISSILGDMMINEKILTQTQFGIVVDQIYGSKDFRGNSLWSLYNWITEALKDSHPSYFDRQHIKVHTYLASKFHLTGDKGLYASGYKPIDILTSTEDVIHTLIE